MTIHVATSPMNWNSDDLPDLRPDIPIEQVLKEMVEAGYEGTEYGTGLPVEPSELKVLLDRYGLALASNFCWISLEDRTRQSEEIDRAAAIARTLAALNVHELILGMRGSPERIALAGRVPVDGSAALSDPAWQALADGVHRLAERCQPLGVRLSVHPHAGSFVETRDELETLFQKTDPAALGLTVDAGHLVYGGADPVEVTRTYGSRVRYVHIKDVHPAVLAESRRQGWSFLESLRHFIFCSLGRGCVDLPQFVAALREAAFAGWMVIEEDTSPDPPLVAAGRNRRYLREHFGI